jgi:hypothetical protein
MDDYESPDDLGSPEDSGDDSEDEEDHNTEIQEISELEIFTETLKRAQKVAVARERELEKGRKRPHRYTGNSQRTRERHAKIRRDMQKKGFLSVGDFFSHIRDKIAKRDTAGQVGGQLDSEVENLGGAQDRADILGAEDGSNRVSASESEEEEDMENDENHDLHRTVSADSFKTGWNIDQFTQTWEDIPTDPTAAAQQKVAEMLADLRAGRTPKDDGLATASDLALDRLHYKDFPALRRARASLEIKSKDKTIDVFFRARITAMLGTLNLYLDSELSYTWRQSSLIVSRSQGHGVNHARNIRTWLHAFLSRGVLPFHHLSAFHAAVLDNEDFALPIQLHLQK